MKEVTYEEWKKNQTPRMMWVWDDDEKDKTKQKVVFVLIPGGSEWPVLTVADECTYETYKHCAEIEKQRRMTNRELSRWLREKPTREFKYNNCYDTCIHGYLYYYESNADKEVNESVVIREDYGEWQEPLVEVEK